MFNEKQFEESGFYFQWHFIEACNLRCKHCYQDGHIKSVDPLLVELTIEQIQKVLSAWDMAGRVSITGGEPL
ncbi:MAG: 4Fe-4S cluster-binding domain-containing protein, partial [Planctomycetia bacterium]|nr:4Fe-4S cluster-binding domain-containing protein [Planctomycetia bacterium]